jgi:Tfp pilus assembly protein PilZ
MAQSNVIQKKEERYYQRKDSRKSFVKNQLLTAKCETIDSMFSASVQDLSPGGAFIYTKKKMTLGQEIAMTIKLPTADEFLMVTGEIIRIASDGYGVQFKIIFND